MNLGVVVIGRNEGERLVACLGSLAKNQYRTIYVDSGSSDGSVQHAKKHKAEVVELDVTIPFTAARARNMGFKSLILKWPKLRYVQFVDGDCTVVEGWFAEAQAFLDKHANVAVVSGRRRERFPDATIYNRLCDIEWDTPVGDAISCGGDAMMRISAVQDVGGYHDDLIAGEEPELCVRLRERGWKIWRLQNEMTLHDANIRRFGQWWKRVLRGGYAYAAVYSMHAGSPQRIWRLELMRAIFWGLFMPLAIFAAGVLHVAAALGLLAIYLLQVARIAMRRGAAEPMSWRYGVFMTIAKFAEAAGILKYGLSRLVGHKTRLIEYK